MNSVLMYTGYALESQVRLTRVPLLGRIIHDLIRLQRGPYFELGTSPDFEEV